MAAPVPGLDPMTSLAMCVHAAPGVYALLLGAGVSRAAGLPTGWDIVTDLVRRAAVARGADPAGAAAAAADPEAWWAAHGSGELGYSALLEQLGDTSAARHQLLRGYFEADEVSAKQPGPAHRAIAALVARGSVRVVLTTNFDRLTEQALAAVGVQPQVISTPDGLRGMTPLAHARATVVKLHGDLADLETRNTEAELTAYPPAWAALLDQVLDEYGLLVCGWSAQWDEGLVRGFERRASRRYPIFWSCSSGPGRQAAELIERHRAVLLTGLTADNLFTGLLARVEALDSLAAPAPTRELAVARLKQALPDPVRRIELHDLVDGETTRTLGRLAGRDQEPRQACDVLLHLLAVGAFHDRAGAHADLWVRTVRRLGDGYPAQLAVGAAGTAAVLAGREELLARLLLEPATDGRLLALPEHQRLRADLAEPLTEPGGGTDRTLHEALDRYRYLTALVQADLDQLQPLPEEFLDQERLTPDGRLRVAVRVQTELVDEWPMLTAGAFGGRLDRAHAAAAVVEAVVEAAVEAQCARRRRAG
ncbi:SIR2 family protein [Kitasatospora azatica]|uniref:SIR2 family protein n=1 Tax=Kitasatospora azatica TaxID=58347 RepID=UPI00068CB839|nr:SIR2 family protein [Kitasatospora azatica]